MNSASIYLVSCIAYCVLREEGRRQKKIISRHKVGVRFIEPVSGRIYPTPTASNIL